MSETRSLSLPARSWLAGWTVALVAWILLAVRASAGTASLVAIPWVLLPIGVFAAALYLRPKPAYRVALAAAYVLLALELIGVFLLAGSM